MPTSWPGAKLAAIVPDDLDDLSGILGYLQVAPVLQAEIKAAMDTEVHRSRSQLASGPASPPRPPHVPTPDWPGQATCHRPASAWSSPPPTAGRALGNADVS